MPRSRPLTLLLASAFAIVSADVADDRDARLLALPEPGRLAASPVAFYRAALPVFLADWGDRATGLSRSRFDDAPTFGVGDPHVENFGTLLGRDGEVSFEPDDLDCAGEVPYLWDLRRLTVGLCVAAAHSNARSSSARRAAANDARELARVAARAYADGIAGAAAPPNGAAVDDLLTKARRAAARRGELDELTVLDGGVRRMRRGAVDRDDPGRRNEDVSPPVREATAELMTSYRASLVDPPDERSFTVLDVARALGRGAMSLGRVRLLVLLRGATDDPGDDVIVEVKELVDPPTPGPHADPVARVNAARGRLWSRADADPYWGAARWRGCPVQVRAETDAARGLRVSRLQGPLGTTAALRALALALGARLAAVHRRTLTVSVARAIAADREGFADEQADAAVRYAELVTRDWRRLQRLVRRRSQPAPAVAPTGPCTWLTR